MRREFREHFPRAADFKGNRQLAILACITARVSRTCRDACQGRLPAVAGKNVPGIPGACAQAILPFWQDVHLFESFPTVFRESEYTCMFKP